MAPECVGDVMNSAIGWLLDVTVERNAATLSIKTIDEDIIRLTDKYLPSFYILPKNEIAGAELFHLLSQQPKTRVESQQKFTDIDADRPEIVLCVYVESTYHYNLLVKRLQNDPRVARLFNTELSHVQQYLFTRLKVEPTSKVQVQYDNERLISLTKIDGLDISPPFTVLHFVISAPSLDSHDVSYPIRQIIARYQEEQDITFEGDEERILRDFCKYVVDNDPDILVSTEQHYRSTSILRYMFARAEDLGLDIQLGRGNINNNNHIDSRVYLDSNSVDIVALIEKARFACLPLGLAARCKISRLIDSRNCYELINRGFVISRLDKQESIRTVKEIRIGFKGQHALNAIKY